MKNEIEELWEKKIIKNEELFSDIELSTKNRLKKITFKRILKDERFSTLTFILGETEHEFYELLFSKEYFYLCSIEKKKAKERMGKKDVNILTTVCKLPSSKANYGVVKSNHKLYLAIKDLIQEASEYIKYVQY